MSDPTIEYYNKNAEAYFQNTVQADMSKIYIPFLKHLSQGAEVLDAGCGSGRDSYFFKQHGFRVTAFDASPEMARLSSKLLGQKVFLMNFADLDLTKQYDGIWACASLIHVPRPKLISIVSKLGEHLNKDGVFYISFKYGNREFYQDGRYFNCLTEETFSQMIAQIPELAVEELHLTKDVRKERENERWLNAYLLKK